MDAACPGYCSPPRGLKYTLSIFFSNRINKQAIDRKKTIAHKNNQQMRKKMNYMLGFINQRQFRLLQARLLHAHPLLQGQQRQGQQEQPWEAPLQQLWELV